MQPRKALAHPNIAFIKYWGNRDLALRIPLNGSISMNLAGLETRTTIRVDASLSDDSFTLNGQPPARRPAPAKGTTWRQHLRTTRCARLANLILKETTTLGVNVPPLDDRFHDETRMVELETKFGKIPVKQKFIEGILAQSKPEYEVMAKIASEAQVSMDELNNKIIGQLMIKPK